MESSNKIKIYCVEDDESIRDLILYALTSSGFEAKGFERSNPFFHAVQKDKPDLILLDLMLPGKDGIEILKTLKSDDETVEIPVIILTAKGSEYDKVKGLDTGADDYMTKPFGVMELISRIKALLRRSGCKGRERDNDDTNQNVLTFGDITVNQDRRTVMAGGNECILTFKEFELLTYLIENKEHVLTRDKILSKVWGIDFEGETRTVDMHIKTLRQKLGDSGSMIKTMRGLGYKISLQEYRRT